MPYLLTRRFLNKIWHVQSFVNIDSLQAPASHVIFAMPILVGGHPRFPQTRLLSSGVQACISSSMWNASGQSVNWLKGVEKITLALADRRQNIRDCWKYKANLHPQQD
jgi:hypothetical protein